MTNPICYLFDHRWGRFFGGDTNGITPVYRICRRCGERDYLSYGINGPPDSTQGYESNKADA